MSTARPRREHVQADRNGWTSAPSTSHQKDLDGAPSLERGAADSQYRCLFSYATDAILVVDDRGIVQDANDSATQLLSRGSSTLVGTPFERILRSPFADQIEGSKTWRGETEACTLTGETIAVEACAIPVDSAYPPITFWTLRDISERRRLANLQEEFLSMAAHELKTPLTSLKGFAQLLQRGVGGTRAAEVVVQQADHLNALVGGLLDVARLESGRIAIHPHTVDLRTVVERATEQTEHELADRTVELDLVDHPVVGYWDGRRLQQVVMNLLSNVAKHAPLSKRVVVRVSEKEGSVQTTVRDFGPGISPAAMSSLFKRFHRVNNPTGRGVEGMGLGLYVCRMIIEAHGGTMQVASKLGEGCAFTFSLPTTAQA